MSNNYYIRPISCPIEDNGILEVFYRSSRNYELYKLLKHNLNDEYKRITNFHRGFSRIEYKYPNAEFILLNEYFLWLNNNDIVELEPFLKWYGDCLAERLCYYDDIFFYEHDDDPSNKVNSGIIQDSTRNLVEQLLRPAIAKKRRELNMSAQALSTSIFNTHTMENIRPNDGTYYIDDFR